MRLLLRTILFLGLATPAAPAYSGLYLYHPAVAGAYAQAVEQIREGIEAQARVRVQPLAYVSPDADATVRAALARVKAEDTIVAIGDEALKSLRQLSVAARIVAGVVALAPTADTPISGISVYAAPAQYFAALSRLLPNTERVHFVHRAELPSEFVAHVARQAERAGLLLEPHAVAGLRDVAVVVDRLLARSPSDHALWLHRGVLEFNSEVLLGPILERSWTQRVAVFSSAPSSVPRGLLFSLYPDYHALGRALGALAVAQGDSEGIRFLTATRAALNLRTARHLGADLAPAVRERFQLLFPAPP